MSELNYEHVFNVLVDKTAEYVTSNNLKVMVLGISGGIDSTVVAAICHEVSKKTGIPLIGRSLPIKNKSDEFATSVHVGEAFCNEFSVYRLERSYRAALFDACADAGDVGDFDPIQDLWKTEVYGLANYLQDHYKSKALEALRNDYKETCDNYKAMSCAIYNSCKLVPTDGLGISNSDLEQIGAKSYAEVDDILQTNANNIFDSTGRWVQPLMEKYGEDVVVKVLSRHVTSEFKRMKAPIYISRELYE